MILFKCKTNHAAIFKYLFDMLFHNMSTVPISIAKTGFTIFNQTDSGYTFNINFLPDKFSEWIYNHSEPIFFGIGMLNSHDFKEFSSKSSLEMVIDERKSPLECIVLKIIILNQSRNLIKKFIIHSEEIPFFSPIKLSKPSTCLELKTQDFTSLCKGFKTGIIHLKCNADGFSITNKLEGIREKCFFFPEKLETTIDAILSADKLLGIIKIAMCVNKTITLWIDENYFIISGNSYLGIIEIKLLY